jgi:hypothetical protein
VADPLRKLARAIAIAIHGPDVTDDELRTASSDLRPLIAARAERRRLTEDRVDAALRATVRDCAKACVDTYEGVEAIGDHPTPEMCARKILKRYDLEAE